jgi:hypothetical protein
MENNKLTLIVASRPGPGGTAAIDAQADAIRKETAALKEQAAAAKQADQAKAKSSGSGAADMGLGTPGFLKQVEAHQAAVKGVKAETAAAATATEGMAAGALPKLGMALGVAGAAATAFVGVVNTMMKDNEQLAKSWENLKDTAGSAWSELVREVVGEGASLKGILDTITTALGGMTEAQKLNTAAVADYVPVGEKAKNTAEKLAEAFKNQAEMAKLAAQETTNINAAEDAATKRTREDEDYARKQRRDAIANDPKLSDDERKQKLADMTGEDAIIKGTRTREDIDRDRLRGTQKADADLKAVEDAKQKEREQLERVKKGNELALAKANARSQDERLKAAEAERLNMGDVGGEKGSRFILDSEGNRVALGVDGERDVKRADANLKAAREAKAKADQRLEQARQNAPDNYNDKEAEEKALEAARKNTRDQQAKLREALLKKQGEDQALDNREMDAQRAEDRAIEEASQKAQAEREKQVTAEPPTEPATTDPTQPTGEASPGTTSGTASAADRAQSTTPERGAVRPGPAAMNQGGGQGVGDVSDGRAVAVLEDIRSLLQSIAQAGAITTNSSSATGTAVTGTAQAAAAMANAVERASKQTQQMVSRLGSAQRSNRGLVMGLNRRVDRNEMNRDNG